MQETYFRGVLIFYTADCSVLSLAGKVNTRRMSQPNMGFIFHIKMQWNILVIGNYYENYQNSMLLTSSDTKRKLLHLFLFTNSVQRKLVSICTQSIRNCNWLSLHYNLAGTKCACKVINKFSTVVSEVKSFWRNSISKPNLNMEYFYDKMRPLSWKFQIFYIINNVSQGWMRAEKHLEPNDYTLSINLRNPPGISSFY